MADKAKPYGVVTRAGNPPIRNHAIAAPAATETRDEHRGLREREHELTGGLDVGPPRCLDQRNERPHPEGNRKKVEDEQRREHRQIQTHRVAGERERCRDRERARSAQHWDEVALGQRDQEGDETG